MESMLNKSNKDLRYIIRWTDLKQVAGEQLLKQSPSNEDLRYIIEYTDLKQVAFEQLLKQSPSNEDLQYIIEYTKLNNEAAKVLCERLGVQPVDEEALIKEIAEAVIGQPGSLNMDHWHCRTTHCLAGWACVINPVAAAIEKNNDTETAGCAVLPNYAKLFFSDNETVLNKLKEINSK